MDNFLKQSGFCSHLRNEVPSSVPGRSCRCLPGRRFYVATSRSLNVRAFEGLAGGVDPFVFKVGSAKICRDRVRSLNEFRKPTTRDGALIFSEPAYAGATDWRILACREVCDDRYDDKVFKGWLASTYDPADVRTIRSVQFPDIAGLDPSKRFIGLCKMSEDFVRRRTGVRRNDPMHDDMLEAVREVMISIADEFAAAHLVAAPGATDTPNGSGPGDGTVQVAVRHGAATIPR